MSLIRNNGGVVIMRLVDYCDFGDLPEFRVETVGSIVLVSPNIIRMTFVSADCLGEALKATHHQFWDVGHWLAAIPAFHAGRAALQERVEQMANRAGVH